MTLSSGLDARTKLVIVMALSSLSILITNLIWLAIIFFVSMAAAFMLNVNFYKILKRLKRIFHVILILVVVQSIFTRGGEPILSIGSITIVSDLGLQMAGQFALRVGIIISSATILTTSSYREIVQGLVQWKMPYEIAFMVSVAIRFLPTFTEEFKDAVVALQLRGIEFEKIPLSKKIKVYSYLFFPVVSNAVLKAQELSMAMETRAFRAYPVRTSYMVLKMKPMDYAMITLSLILTISAMLLYYY
ncbi:MAG: energy-coupling factor transporter transmembrane protein EcfT [Clostridia bacterium]|nr:energy-coupling factor transporter transmembrane protein EcfT [Clostridia bacterium]